MSHHLDFAATDCDITAERVAGHEREGGGISSFGIRAPNPLHMSRHVTRLISMRSIDWGRLECSYLHRTLARAHLIVYYLQTHIFNSISKK